LLQNPENLVPYVLTGWEEEIGLRSGGLIRFTPRTCSYRTQEEEKNKQKISDLHLFE